MNDVSELPGAARVPQSPWGSSEILDAGWLRRLCLDAGADDAGFAEIGRAELAGERQHILRHFPQTKTLVALMVRMNRGPVRSTARSVANLEFHRAGDHVNDVARAVVRALEDRGVWAANPAMAFPMDMEHFPDRAWVVSHKLVAVAAGIGQMGINRLVIHPKSGAFVLLGTILIGTEVSAYGRPLDFNPCLECKLCVSACPTGAIAPDGYFNFSACYTHNYREFMSGFTDWVETIAAAGSARAYREKVSAAESVSMWQSLGYGPNYKAAYCMAVCPAGEDVVGPYRTDRKTYVDEVVKPFRDKAETVYAVRGSDTEVLAPRRFPNKRVKRVGNGLTGAGSIRSFLDGLPLVFQRGQAKGLSAIYHFTFTGRDPAKATVVIRDQRLTVVDGHQGRPDFRLWSDASTWLAFLRKETGLASAMLRGRVRFWGAPRLLLAFGRCFPS